MCGSKKLLYLIGSRDPGGAERVVIDLARSFRLKLYDVTVGHLGNPWLMRKLNEYDINNVQLEFSKYYFSHKTEWIFVLNLIRFIKEEGFDLVHSHLFGMILYSSIAGSILRKPVIGTIHDKYYFSEKKYRILAYKIVQMLGCRLVVVSKDIKSSLSVSSNIKQDDIIAIYNGTELGNFDMDFNRSLKRKEFYLNDDDIIVISVGRLAKIKGHSNIISAARKIVRQNERIKFIIVGDGPEEVNLKKMAEAEGIDEHFIFTGYREDVNELLKISDIFVQTSFSEGLSCTIIEALAAGCPVVVTDVGGNREILNDGREGYLVPLGDESAIENRLLTLADDYELRMRLAKNAKETAKAKFSLETMIANYERLYRRVLT